MAAWSHGNAGHGIRLTARHDGDAARSGGPRNRYADRTSGGLHAAANDARGNAANGDLPAVHFRYISAGWEQSTAVTT